MESGYQNCWEAVCWIAKRIRENESSIWKLVKRIQRRMGLEKVILNYIIKNTHHLEKQTYNQFTKLTHFDLLLTLYKVYVSISSLSNLPLDLFFWYWLVKRSDSRLWWIAHLPNLYSMNCWILEMSLIMLVTTSFYLSFLFIVYYEAKQSILVLIFG